LIEAALAKVPIITTDVGIVGEVFKGYEDVLAAPVADPTELSLHIVTLIENANARIELPMHAEGAVRDHLNKQGNVAESISRNLSDLVGTL
jgi:glycosyltransferase involved in cell wall biosynthesis